MLDIHGKYRVILDGKVVEESPNIITTVGVNTIRQFLVGNISDWGNSIAIGADNAALAAGSTSVAIGNTALGYEYNRQPVISKFINSSNQIVLRAAFPIGLACKVNEIGVFPYLNADNIGTYQDVLLTDFSEGIGGTGWSAGTVSSGTNSLVGSGNLTANVATTLSNLYYDLSSFSPTDTIDLIVWNSGGTGKTITLAISDGTTTYTYPSTFSVSTATGAQKVSLPLGSPGISYISSITLTPSASLEFDVMKLTYVQTSGLPNQVVSRTIPTQIVKSAGQDMEIEYVLTVA